MSKTTLVTCLFDCHQGSDFDANGYYYKKSLRTLAAEQPMIIFCEKMNEDYFRGVRKALKLEEMTHIITCELSDFYFYKFREQIDKRYGRSKGGKSHNAEFYVVWFSKIEMIMRSVELNPFNSTHFIWMDVNLLTKTFNNSLNYIEDSVYEKINKICENPKDKFSIELINFWQPSDYENLISFFSVNRWIVAAAFFSTDIPTIKFIGPKFIEKSEELFLKEFCQADEQIYAFLIDEYPDYFDLFVGDYEDSINNYFGFETKNYFDLNQYNDWTLSAKTGYINNVLKKYELYRPEMYKKITEEFKITYT